MDARLERLLDLLDSVETESVGTSVRLPARLRDAAVVAAELGLISSTSELTTRGLRAELELVARRAVLEAHYEEYPRARPDLAEIAQMAAELHAHPLAGRPDLIRKAADDLARIVPDPSPAEVLAYAAGLAAAA
ncbi:MAG: hypothetical protein L0H84_16140 [Pseudonocardia sp.]|nr:hypothetical protein [Pseudonocardia sp.]